jgi:4-amino-4-deoxy-L-arabinose transferase-like glycosyltransferase
MTSQRREPRSAAEVALIVLLFACAAWLYFFRVGALPFVVDEIYHGVVARAILEGGLPTMPNGSLYLKGVLFSYLGALATAVLGSPEAGVRSISGLSVLLTGWCVERTVRRHVDARLAWFALSIWLFHPWVVEFARWGRLYPLATLLLTASVMALLDYDDEPSVKKLALTLCLMLLAFLVYPLSILGVFGAAVFLAHRAYERHPERRTAIRRWSIVCSLGVPTLVAALYGLSFWVPALELRNWAVVFSGATGKDPPSVARFVKVSPYYLRFYFLELPGLAWLPLVVFWSCWQRRASKAFVRSRALVLWLSYGAVLFVTTVHLQSAASRYLFAALPFAVLGTAMALADLLGMLNPVHERFARYGLTAVLAAGVLVSGVWRVPFRQAGDLYAKPHFSPSLGWRRHWDFRAGSTLVRDQAKQDDLVITSQSIYHYNYAGAEADYVFVPSYGAKGKPLAPYLAKTREVSACRELEGLVNKSKRRVVWLHVWETKRVRACLKRVKGKRRSRTVYSDGVPNGIRVYQLEPRKVRRAVP